jgi:hypothetical protein
LSFNHVPLIVDQTLSPVRVREVANTPGEGVPPRVLPLATTSTDGAMSAADKTALNGTPAAIASAVATEAATRAAADGSEASTRAAADSSLDSRVSSLETGTPTQIAAAVASEAAARSGADSAEASTRAAADTSLDARLDAIESAFDPLAEENAGLNLLTASPLTPAEERGLFKQRNASTGELEFRPIHPGADLETHLVGDSIEVARRPKIWVPAIIGLSRAIGYRPVRRQGIRTAGAQGDTTKLADNHGSAHRYPLMLWAALDVNGFPHNRHKRLESDNAGNDSGELGYEFGHDIRAGDFRDGRALKWFGRGRCENVTWTDAFWDWAVEINPTVGVYAGPYRLRMPSPPLLRTWAGENRFDWSVELRSEGWKAYSVVGKWTIFDAGGDELLSWKKEAHADAGFDFLAAASRVQLSWRVERDKATRLDTFDNTNQGANQGANRLRCSVRTYGLDWDGFPQG